MTKTLQRIALCSALLFLSVYSTAQSTEAKIATALKMDYRTDAEKARDANRAPVEALKFMGFQDDMKVIEYFPAGGWYSKVIAPVLADKGSLYLIDSNRTFERWGDLLDNPAFKSAHKLPIEASYNREEGRYEIGAINIGFNDADMFLNIREYHNLNLADKNRLNKAAFDSLKSGGTYVIIDHTRRHMQPETRVLGRREDPVQVILEVQDAGFVLEKASGMFLRENDGLNLEVGDKSVTGQTDRFFLVFKKP